MDIFKQIIFLLTEIFIIIIIIIGLLIVIISALLVTGGSQGGCSTNADCWYSRGQRCDLKRHPSKCFEEVACPGNPEDVGYSCLEGQESYEKNICLTSQCRGYWEDNKWDGADFDQPCSACPDIIDNAPENCHLVCVWVKSDCSEEPIGEEYYCTEEPSQIQINWDCGF